ncbi:unnamed protein product [Oppiella nova]|uniref:Peptide chain release factor 2 n=1 Tax=Oppiella nova TaxID=334625 RepID=A0A7R9LBX8_9ACAR|nr:unnamed protein product [Oppiella nova]CAG2160593.1 unnamed protein product [Oppiella nova]
MSKRNEAAQALEDSKSDIGWGSQIRSYVLDDSRIKDLRTGVENSNTGAVLDGDLDKFIEASLKQANPTRRQILEWLKKPQQYLSEEQCGGFGRGVCAGNIEKLVRINSGREIWSMVIFLA